jgi:hypothetical protein
MDHLPRAQYFVADYACHPVTVAGRIPSFCVEAPQPMAAPDAVLIADFWISTRWIAGASGKVKCFPLAG